MKGKFTSTKNINEGVQLLRNRKTLSCMIKETWRGNYKMSMMSNVIVVLGILYVIIPLDFDWLPIIGWIDDAFVIFFVIKRLQKETQRFNRHKAMERKRAC